MLALIAGDEQMRGGPIPVALAYAGFTVRATPTIDEATDRLDRHGPGECLLVVDAASLDNRTGSATWASFLSRHRTLAAVVVAHDGAEPEASALAGAPHRILLEDPFDAAAIVAAARRASSSRGLQRVSPPLRAEGLTVTR